MALPRALASTRSCLKVMAERGGRVDERDGITACSMPSVPGRSLPNSVFYESGADLAAAYRRLADFYADVDAWTVWVPEDDLGVAELLESHGHVMDADPSDMEIALPGFAPSVHIPDWQRGSVDQLAEINDAAYPWRDGSFARMIRDGVSEEHFLVYAVDDVCALAVHDHGADAYITFVATRPEGRGSGLASGLLAAALVEARDRGRTISTLVATKSGQPIYTRLGYATSGATQMWEKRG